METRKLPHNSGSGTKPTLGRTKELTPTNDRGRSAGQRAPAADWRALAANVEITDAQEERKLTSCVH